MSVASTSSPYTLAATAGAIAAVCPSCSSPATSMAASAVDDVATVVAPGSSLARNDRHCAVATGIDSTRRTSDTPTPLAASRFICTPITTSRWISSPVSNASVSTVTVTAPSIEFSTATNPRSTCPRLDGPQDVGDRRQRHQRSGGQVGLRQQRLLGECALGTQEADALPARGPIGCGHDGRCYPPPRIPWQPPSPRSAWPATSPDLTCSGGGAACPAGRTPPAPRSPSPRPHPPGRARRGLPPRRA